MESYTLELYPNRGPIHFCLFQNVLNAPELRDKFQHDQSLGMTLIDARKVLSKFHLLLAINRAIHDEQTTKLKTSNIHSEILFAFATNNNIAKTFKSFGVLEDTRNVIAIRLGNETKEEALEYIQQYIKGDLVSFEELNKISDLKAIEKLYELGDKENDAEMMMPLIATAMGLRGHA